MAFIPYERFTVETSLSAQATAAKLFPYVEPYRFLRNPFAKSHKKYEGRVTPDGFKILRIIHTHNNPFLPVIKGKFEPIVGGTRVTISMRPYLHTTTFLILFVGFSIYIAVMGLLVKDGSGIGIGLFMLLFLYLFSTIAFNSEANRSRKFLTKLYARRRRF